MPESKDKSMIEVWARNIHWGIFWDMFLYRCPTNMLMGTAVMKFAPRFPKIYIPTVLLFHTLTMLSTYISCKRHACSNLRRLPMKSLRQWFFRAIKIHLCMDHNQNLFFILVGLEHEFYFPSYMGCHPNPIDFNSIIFQDGYCTTNQITTWFINSRRFGCRNCAKKRLSSGHRTMGWWSSDPSVFFRRSKIPNGPSSVLDVVPDLQEALVLRFFLCHGQYTL